MKYPFILGPKEHNLGLYYQGLSKWSYAFLVIPVVLNEIFIRPNLSSYQVHPQELWSILALTMNAQIPFDIGMWVVLHVFIPLSLLFVATLLLLPSWGPRASIQCMKSGLPPKDEYSNSYYFFRKPHERIAFAIWHFLLMRISLVALAFIPSMSINLFRSLP